MVACAVVLLLRWSYMQRSSPPGVFIVLLGLVRVEVEQPGGRKIDRFVGVGGSVGTVPSIIGRDLPGVALVAAYGQVKRAWCCVCCARKYGILSTHQRFGDCILRGKQSKYI